MSLRLLKDGSMIVDKDAEWPLPMFPLSVASFKAQNMHQAISFGFGVSRITPYEKAVCHVAVYGDSTLGFYEEKPHIDGVLNHFLGPATRRVVSESLLCRVCKAMIEDNINGGFHHSTSSAVSKAASARCWICFHLNKAIAKVGLDRVDWPHAPSFAFDVFELHLFRQFNLLNIQFRTPDTPVPIADISPYSAPSFTGHPAVLERGIKWLTKCEESHESCRRVSSMVARESWLPQRLIDLRERPYRIISTHDSGVSGKYAALSHCWGKQASFLTLTAANLTRLGQELRLEDLPQTFVDAIQVTKALSIDFLWIDSLCILQSGQGSEQDWLKHVTDMQHIYSNCTVNISADSVASPYGGMFSWRDPLELQRCEVEWTSSKGEKTSFELVIEETHGRRALSKAPLASRAWVTQERLLSPRVLHFGSSQLFWECSELKHASETHPEGLNYTRFDDMVFGAGRPFSIESLHDVVEDDTGENMAGLWAWVLSMYTSSNLTKPDEDKYNALAGIAQRFAIVKNDEYIAGYFRKSMLHDMLWSAGEATRYHGSWRAPTWSWASMDGPLEFSWAIRAREGAIAEIVSYDVELKDSTNPFGAIKSAKLTVRGKLLELPSGRSTTVAKYYREALKRAEEDKGKAPRTSPWVQTGLDIDEDFDPSKGKVGLLVVRRSWASSQQSVDGLLIQYSTRDDAWRRVGVYKSYLTLTDPTFKTAPDDTLVVLI